VKKRSPILWPFPRSFWPCSLVLEDPRPNLFRLTSRDLSYKHILYAERLLNTVDHPEEVFLTRIDRTRFKKIGGADHGTLKRRQRPQIGQLPMSCVASPAGSFGSLHSDGSLGSFGNSLHSQHGMQSMVRVQEALDQAAARDAHFWSSHLDPAGSNAPQSMKETASAQQEPAGPPVGEALLAVSQDPEGLRDDMKHSVAYSKFLHFAEKVREVEGKRRRSSRQDTGRGRHLPGEGSGSSGESGANRQKPGEAGCEDEVSARPAKRAKP